MTILDKTPETVTIVLDETVREIGNVPYVAATSIDKSKFFEQVVFVLKVLVDVIKSFFVVGFLVLKTFISFCLPKRRKDISGRIALVTGSGNGLGREIAFSLAAKNCNVVIVDLDLNAALNTAIEINRQYNVSTKAYKCDVSDYDEVLKLKENIENDLGPVDILINNAGVLPFLSLTESDDWRDYDKVFKINLHSHFWTTRIFLKGMKERKYGHIVAVSSLLGIVKLPFAILYTTTKHGLTAFMAALAAELEYSGLDYIKTTCASPYFINTRKTLIDNVNLRFPPLSVEWTASEIVDAMLKNYETKFIGKFTFVFSFLALLPRKMETAAVNCLMDVTKIFMTNQ